MNKSLVLRAIADDTRMKIITLLLRHNYCVRALARKLELSEGAVSQHLKILREAGLLTGERKGHFIHYDVNREVLRTLAAKIEELASIERQPCTSAQGGCQAAEQRETTGNAKDCGSPEEKRCGGTDSGSSES